MTHYISKRLGIPRVKQSRVPTLVLLSLLTLLVLFVPPVQADNFVSFHESTEAQSSVDCLAEAMFYEARGDGKFGMFVAGEVIRNRVEDDYYEFKYHNTYCEVIQQPSRDPARPWLCAFSYYCDGKPEVYNLDNPAHIKAVNMAYKMATAIINEREGSRMNFTDGALYYTQHVVSKGWMDRTEVTLVYKGHTFRKPIEEEEVEVEWPRVYSEEHYNTFVAMNEMSQGHYFEQVEADYIRRDLYNTVGITGYDQMLERYKKENNYD